jgi:uncharacterized protein (DUF2236 family)
VIVSRADHEAGLARLGAELANPSAGIFGPGSTNWALAHDIALFLGGGRAVLLQLAHPFVAHAIDQHSRTRSDVGGRFRRTFEGVFAMVFADWEHAAAAARRVHAIHARAHGTLPADVGEWRAGTRYHANDVDALAWVHATLLDTTIAIRELIDGPIDEHRKDRFVVELHRFGTLFGIPPGHLPGSWRAHQAYMDAMLPRLAVAPCAREMAGFLVGRSTERAQPALGRVVEATACALLPPRLIDEFDLRGSPRAARAGLAAFAALYRCLPARAVELPAYSDARDRLAGRTRRSRYTAWSERVLFALAARATG